MSRRRRIFGQNIGHLLDDRKTLRSILHKAHRLKSLSNAGFTYEPHVPRLIWSVKKLKKVFWIGIISGPGTQCNLKVCCIHFLKIGRKVLQFTSTLMPTLSGRYANTHPRLGQPCLSTISMTRGLRPSKPSLCQECFRFGWVIGMASRLVTFSLPAISWGTIVLSLAPRPLAIRSIYSGTFRA